MRILTSIILLLYLPSCSNWAYKDIQYDYCVSLEESHIHFYNHNFKEWSCLNIEKGKYIIKDSFRIKYKTDKKGKVKKVKLIK
jgi:hypothetical protein